VKDQDTLVKQNKDELQKESFGVLLKRLNTDQKLAEEKYLTIRNKLIIFFRTRGFSQMDLELADKTIDRAARKLFEQENNQSENSETQNILSDSYFLSVAHFVLKEHQRGVKPTVAIEDLPANNQLITNNNQEQNLIEQEQTSLTTNCFNECLSNFPIEQKLLIIEYFSVEITKAEQRQFLADKLGININALRVKAHRLRQDLVKCVENCVKKAQK
jgi:hypothetical protein